MVMRFPYYQLMFRSYNKFFTMGFLILGIGLFLAFVGTVLAQPVSDIHINSELAPIINAGLPNRIPDQYIVVFKQGTNREVVLSAQKRVNALGGKIQYKYASAIVGFSVKMSANALQALRVMPGIAYIGVDQVGLLNTVQNAPPDGLDRVSERFLPLDNRYTYSEIGTGVHVYVIDTGIRATHTEFGGRVSGGTNVVSGPLGTDDCTGHGTHLAGTIGGGTYGIAKNVSIHPLKVADASCMISLSSVVTAVNWVTMNATKPAVAIVGTEFSSDLTLITAMQNSILSGVTYVVSAGNASTSTCGSPADVTNAITVGAIDPTNDHQSFFSNFGACLDLFAPGNNIRSATSTNDTATITASGTSQAAAHVAGVAARYLQTYNLATPADVWNAIHNANNRSTTIGWPGILSLSPGSPNESLHYGSLNDGYNDGDPHIMTVNGIHYDFQASGEFVALRDANGMEIQTRQTPVPSAPWVSVNTAIAARVGNHRVTWGPNISGVPDPSGLQLLVDGVPTTIGENGLALDSGGRVVKSIWDGIEIHFPNGTLMVVTSNWWGSQRLWVLNVRVFHTPATEGIMGVIAPNSWLKPEFAKTWRVTEKTTLFDYAGEETTKTFTLPIFPKEKIPPMKPENVVLAQNVCGEVVDNNMKKDCVFDVAVTGDPIFAKSSLVSQMIQNTVKGRQSPNVCTPIPSDSCKRHARWWQHFWPWSRR